MTNVSDPRLSLCENDRFQKRSYSACFQPENNLYKNLGNSVVLVLILVCHSRILSIECNLVFLLRTVHYTTGDGRALSTREEVFMAGPLELNLGPSLADVLLCTFESTTAGFSSFPLRKLLS
jgi:hypothetical protein